MDSQDKAQELRSQDGLFLGTVGGTPQERTALAAALRDFYDQLSHSFSRPGVYRDIGISVRIVDGKIAQIDVPREAHYKPEKR